MSTLLLLPAKYVCPVCHTKHDSLAEKKAHVKAKHPRPKEDS